MGSLRRLKRSSLNRLFLFLSIFVVILFVLVILISMFKLSENSVDRSGGGLSRALNVGKEMRIGKIGPFGEKMLEMLPDDLAFTVFLPSEQAFESDLKLKANESLSDMHANDTYAILSRVLGFTAVPQHFSSIMIQPGTEISLDSVSGLKLYVSKGKEKALFVNTIAADVVDIRREHLIIHIMRGVIMDAEFEQSFDSDDEEDE